MNPRYKLTIGAFVTAYACALAAAPPRQHAQEAAPQQSQVPEPAKSYEVVTSYPPGAVGVFPEPVELRAVTPLSPAFARPAGAQTTPKQLWVLNTSLLDFRPEADEPTAGAAPGGKPPAAAQVKKLLAFTVPQLPRGTYVVSYVDRVERSMTISVEPQLQAEHGLLTGNPGDTVEVSFGLGTSYVAVNDKGVSQTRAPVTLSIADASVAEMAPGQPASRTTGEDGFATWKVRLKAAGETALRATAPDFEPAEARLVSTRRPTTPEAKTAEERADKAEAEADALEERARAARVESEQAKVAMLILKAQSMGGAGFRAKDSGEEPARRMAALEESLKRSEVAEGRAEARQASQLKEMAAVRARMAALLVPNAVGGPETSVASVATPLLSPDALLPGDIILMRGLKFYSTAILAAETLNFGHSAPYSHAAVYVGGGMVAEMLGDGYNLRPLGVSIDKATYADVYRWEGLGDAQRELIAAKGKSYAAGRYPYAWPQIGVLGVAATAAAPLGALSLAAAGASLTSGGDRQMICSELVARAYHHAGLDPTLAERWRVSFWPTLGEILSSDDRRHDYTTPNALAASPLLAPAKGRLK
ncbi:MAG TPA: hypothetical protein VN282_11050 [Pyrinomonadaceae bacterium]|nr:hypothetical protein [Pyrinomonadaceae bacterium]